MFITIITALLLLVLTAESLIYTQHLRNKTTALKRVYFTLVGLCILPYTLLCIIGRIWELHSTLFSFINTVAITLFMMNALWKIPLLPALLLSKPSTRQRAAIVALLFSALMTVLISKDSFFHRNKIEVTHFELHFDNLPQEADGLRIAQIGDLHIGRTPWRHHILQTLSNELTRLQPDLIIDCGDMVNSHYDELDSLSMKILSQISAPLGVYTVMGNHDRGDYILDTISLPRSHHRELLRQRQRAMGWHNITDHTHPLIVGNDTLFLSAIDYPSTLRKGSHGEAPDEEYHHHFDTIPQEAFNIVMAHTPMQWPAILKATDAELTLSGHVHAMQMRLSVGKWMWSPAALVYDHWGGHYSIANANLVITNGIGGSIPLRLGIRPEIVLITLRHK